MSRTFGRGLGIRSIGPCIDVWCLLSLGFVLEEVECCLLLLISLICYQLSPHGVLLVVHFGIVWVLSNPSSWYYYTHFLFPFPIYYFFWCLSKRTVSEEYQVLTNLDSFQHPNSNGLVWHLSRSGTSSLCHQVVPFVIPWQNGLSWYSRINIRPLTELCSSSNDIGLYPIFLNVEGGVSIICFILILRTVKLATRVSPSCRRKRTKLSCNPVYHTTRLGRWSSSHSNSY